MARGKLCSGGDREHFAFYQLLTRMVCAHDSPTTSSFYAGLFKGSFVLGQMRPLHRSRQSASRNSRAVQFDRERWGVPVQKNGSFAMN